MGKIVFYHYTSSESSKAIRKSGVIRKSVQKAGNGDVVYGEGTYGTPLGPENGREALARNNYDGAWKNNEDMGKVDVVIRIVMDDSKVKHISDKGREIYLHDGDICLDEADEVDFIYKGESRVEKYK